MSITTLRAAAFALSFAASVSALAIPAKPGLIPMTQPDGSVINVRLVGDEHSHYTLSEDGYLLTPVNDTYYYATIAADGSLTSTDIRASRPAERSAEARAFLQTVNLDEQNIRMQARDAVVKAERAFTTKTNPFTAPGKGAKAPGAGYTAGPGLFPGSHFPAIGEQKGLVILVEYADVTFNLQNPHDYFSRMLNEPGFSDYDATGSAVDFFRESSTDLFRPQFDVYGPITLSQNRSYYGGNDYSGNDKNPEKMAIEACQQLDETVDFTQYDRDGDGYIDNVFIFYAGRGEASGGSADTVWPHAWNVTAATYTPYYFDGVQLDRYACSNEWESGRPDGVGTFVHEFSHVMGLPDLYATSYTSSFTPGAWSAMDYGPYNNDGMTPPLYSAFERYALGWIEPCEITGPMDVTLSSIGNNVCGIVKTDRTNEYFLFENRQQKSWDTYIPSHGMLVWHIDYSEYVWNSNVVNNTPSHQYVDIEEADGTRSEYSRAGDPFPGTSHVTEFTSSGNPSFTMWNGTAIDLPLTEIAENDGVITFKVAGGREESLPVTTALPATDPTATSFTANWEAVEGAACYMLSVRRIYPGTDLEPETVFTNRNVGNTTSYNVDNLEPDAIYEYDVCVGSAIEYSAPSNVITAGTGRLPLDLLTPKAIAATEVTETSFTANWLPLEDADDYLLTISEKVWGAPIKDLCDFADGAKVLPYGWTSSSQAGYANAAYSGEAAPSLRFSNSGDFIATCRFDDDIKAVSFWHRGTAVSNEADCINILGRIDGRWVKLSSVPVVKSVGGCVTTFDEIPEGVRSIRLEYVKKDKAAVAIDDIVISWGTTFEKVPVETYPEPIHTGNVTSVTLSDLKPGTTYVYGLTATDGTLVSMTSNEIEVTTEGTAISAVKEIGVSAAESFSVDGRTVTALAHITIFDLTGRTVAELHDGSSATLPSGLYIVKSSNSASKIIIR